MAFKFEELRVWHQAMDLSADVSCLIKKFPREERYVLSTQMQRAADSVVLNISEGSTGQTDAEFKKFIGYAIRSALEVVSCLHLGKRRSIISEEAFNTFYDQLTVLVKGLQALRNSI